MRATVTVMTARLMVRMLDGREKVTTVIPIVIRMRGIVIEDCTAIRREENRNIMRLELVFINVMSMMNHLKLIATRVTKTLKGHFLSHAINFINHFI